VSTLWLAAIQNAVNRNSLGQDCTKNHVAIRISSEGSIQITFSGLFYNLVSTNKVVERLYNSGNIIYLPEAQKLIWDKLSKKISRNTVVSNPITLYMNTK